MGRRRRSPLFTAVMLLLATYLLYLSVPNIGFAIRAARADGTPGVFTPQRLSCIRHPGHESCSWTGEFRSRDGRVHRTRVSLRGSTRESLSSGTGVAAIDIGRTGQVYGPEGSREWIPTTLLLLCGVAVLGHLAAHRRDRLPSGAVVSSGSGYDRGSRSLARRGIMSDQYEAVFARYDTDGDGRLTVDEVTAAVAGMFPAAEVNDLSGIVKALFTEYDTDHDGLLSVAEFVPLADNLPELGAED